MGEIKDRPELSALIEKAKARFAAMTPEEREAEIIAQRESWLRGEMAMGEATRAEARQEPDDEWRCEKCGCRSFANVDERGEDGLYTSVRKVRCVNCKAVTTRAVTPAPLPAGTVTEEAWSYTINYGPDGEENYANVYTPDGEVVGNLKIHHARAIVGGLNEAAFAAGPVLDEAEQKRYFDAGWDNAKMLLKPEDLAVDRFATAMKAKLKWERDERGRDGWQDMSAEELSKLLYEHLPKGDPVDVANLAMMLHQNGQQIAARPAAVTEGAPDYWAVWSSTGTHLGTWTDEGEARAALAAYEAPIPHMKGVIKPLFSRPAEPVAVTDEYEAMVAAMENLDPAMIPNLTVDQRVALSRFAKPRRDEPPVAAPISTPAPGLVEALSDEVRGSIAYALTKRLVIDMPTARAAVDEALSSITETGGAKNG